LIPAEVVPPVSDEQGPISSTRIREALRSGDPEAAARLLTRPFAIEGVVEHGDKRGRTIGYPTANLSLDRYLRPRFGVYAVRGRLAGGRRLDGAANLGIRPTFEPPKELLEPYFFDFDGDLYGQTIEVELISFLRPEAKFDSLDAAHRANGEGLRGSPAAAGQRLRTGPTPLEWKGNRKRKASRGGAARGATSCSPSLRSPSSCRCSTPPGSRLARPGG
jgi:hypothetical protein